MLDVLLNGDEEEIMAFDAFVSTKGIISIVLDEKV